MVTLAIVSTWDGPCAAAYGACRVCGWAGWDSFDIGLERGPDGAWTHDDPPEAVCPCCGLHEVAVRLSGADG